jgi:hypothetical protein
MLRTVIYFFVFFLFGCANYPVKVAVPVLGIMGQEAELYEGQTIGSTSGSITLVGVVSGTRCQGNYKYTYVSANGVGSTGLASFRCKGGRSAKLLFMTESAEEGWGFAADNKGVPVIFTFGKNDFETVEIYKQFSGKN